MNGFINILREILQYRVFIITPIFICLIILLFLQFVKIVNTERIFGGVLERYDAKIKDTGNLSGLQKKMSQKGIMYRMNNFNLMPSSYLTVRAMIGATTGILSFSFLQVFSTNLSLIVAISFTFLGFYFTEILFDALNKRDNEEMLMDIYNSYVALKTQLQAGQYISDVMKYIYENATVDRYKQALMELVLNMSDKTVSSTRAVEIFRDRFDNPDIKKFCSVLNSFYIYGINDKFINNLTREIEAVISATTIREEENIKRKTGMISFAMFATIIVAIGYCIITGFEGIDFF